jgi:hypothetical protein
MRKEEKSERTEQRVPLRENKILDI